jgi:ral guanine nucleotide dissociation stimulator-like 1
LDRDATPPNASILSAGSTTSSLSSNHSASHKSASLSAGGTISAATAPSPAAKVSGNSSKSTPSTPVINGQLVQTPEAKANLAPDFYIVKVSYEQTDDVDGVVMYKSMMLGNNERTPTVIRNAMMKLGLDTDPDSYLLAQILPENRELVLPQNANVYYAINTNFDLNFILKPKKK